MVNFRSGLWSTKEHYHCMWKDERPIPESGVQEPAFYYLPKTGIWRYDDVEAGDTDYLVAKWPLTSWEE